MLAGTPLQNNLGELFSLLNLLMPGVFSCSSEFEAFFEAPVGSGSAEDRASMLSEEQSLLVANRFHAILAPFMLRRLKAQVMADVPAKVSRWVLQLAGRPCLGAAAAGAACWHTDRQPAQRADVLSTPGWTGSGEALAKRVDFKGPMKVTCRHVETS